MNFWYDLELLIINEEGKQAAAFYKDEYNRSDSNAGFDLHSSEDVLVEQIPRFIPFGIIARLIKVQPMPGGTSNDYLKTDSHFWLMCRSSIYKTGLIMGNSTGTIDKSYLRHSDEGEHMTFILRPLGIFITIYSYVKIENLNPIYKLGLECQSQSIMKIQSKNLVLRITGIMLQLKIQL